MDRTDLFFTENPVHTSSLYSASKSSADLLDLAYHRTYDLPVMISRCSNNYCSYQLPGCLLICASQKSMAIIMGQAKVATFSGTTFAWCVEFYKQYGLTTKVIPVTTEEYYLSKAKRPVNSRLDKSKLVEVGFKLLPTWGCG